MKHLGMAIALLVAAVALLAACGGGGDSGDSAATGQAQAEPEEGPDAQADEDLSDAERIAAVAARARAEGVDTAGRDHEFAMTERELVTAIDAVEALVASCMREAGFEYVPVDVLAVREAMDSLGEVQGISDEDFATQWGFGISTGLPEAKPALVLGENARILAGLSSSDAVAYTLTLLGEDKETAFFATLEDEDVSETGGCTRAAIEQVLDPANLNPGYYNPIDALVETDPRLLAAYEDWASCMREEGFDFQNLDTTESEFQDRLDRLLGDRDIEALSGSDSAALATLQGEEKAVAVRALECTEEHVADVEEAVEFEYIGIRSS